ncbi:MAG TPA: glycosyltransferase [Candidatus Woesebacteria bacterium]|nr:glycosyltransferase [Candidatus Woesebacteria bacterium]
MAKKKILVLTDTLPWGHRSIAKAIYGFLKEKESENNYEVIFREVKAMTGMAIDMYVFSYRYMPASNRLLHRLSHKPAVRELLEKSSRMNLPSLKRLINEVKPDLVLSTYFFHTHSLARWRKEKNKKFRLWTVAADPWTINPMSFIRDADLTLVYDEKSVEEGLAAGLSREQMLITGWWTRLGMYEKYDYKESRKKLGFEDDRPVIFIGGGSLGTSALPKLLPLIMIIDKKVGLVINTGTDKLAYKMVEQYKKMFSRFKKNDDVKIVHLGWIENMAEVLSGCDMVLGKAGPNFLFDTVACQKPFVAITHIGGQEDGNIELIKKKKLGWVKERNKEILDFILSYLDRPKYFEKKYQENIKKEADKNKKTLPLILEKIKKDVR